MEDHGLDLDLGMLCRCCDCSSFALPDTSGLTDSQVKAIEELCKLCIEIKRPKAVNL